MRNGEGEFGVQDRKLRVDVFTEHMTDFQLLFPVGDDRTAVHLAAGSDHGQHAPDRNDFAGYLLKAVEIPVPRVLVAVNRDRNRLRIVADRTAADRKDEVRFCRSGACNALAQLVCRGVRHNSGIFKYFLTVCFEYGNHFVIDSVLFDGAAAVNQQDVLSVFRKLGVQSVKRVLAEIKLGWIAISKIS